MSVLERTALEESPLADLHAIASELSIDGYRRLRRAELIDTIVERQGGAPAKPARKPSSRSTTSTRSRAKAKAKDQDKAGDKAGHKAGDKDDEEKPAKPAKATRAKAKPKPKPKPAAEGAKDKEAKGGAEDAADDGGEDDGDSGRRRRRRSGRSRTASRDEARTEETDSTEGEDGSRGEEAGIEGVVELLANGSGFVRVNPPEPSDEDVYVSAAQVKRCELVSGDRVTGPRRTPRRSERFASLVRIDTINGRPASEQTEGARYDELPAAFATERFKLGSEDPTVKAIEWLTPFGRGSRVTIVGAARSGKSEALRRLLEPLAAADETLQCSLVLAGVRPEEISLWNDGPVQPVSAVSFAASSEAQGNAVELAVDQAKRVAARGAHAVVLIDTLDGLHHGAARKALAAARKLVDGGSLTIIATATEPFGGESTVIALDAALTSTARFPALDLAGSGTIGAELLVGEAGAEAIARARAEALDA